MNPVSADNESVFVPALLVTLIVAAELGFPFESNVIALGEEDSVIPVPGGTVEVAATILGAGEIVYPDELMVIV